MKVHLVGTVHLVPGTPAAIPHILSLLEAQGMVIEGNPDIYVREYRAFGIDDAIELRDRSSRRAIMSPQRIFIVATPGMTNEAQNALLKTLEEPPADAAFFFIVPSPEALLQTLRSRAQILTLDIPGMYKESVDVKTFLAATPQKRLDMLKPLLEKGEDEKRDTGGIIAFLSSLERVLAKKPEAMPAGRQGIRAARREGIESVYRARKYMSDKGALVKPLLEQVALLVPKM